MENPRLFRAGGFAVTVSQILPYLETVTVMSVVIAPTSVIVIV